MAREDADAIAGCESPHADGFVDLVAGGEEVGAVGVPRDLVDAGVVAGEEAEVGDMVLAPDADGFVPAAAGEVVAEGTPADVPDGAVVAFEDAEAGEGFEGPEADGFVGGG